TFTREVPVPYPVEGAVRVDDQAIFQPRAYVLGLLERAIKAGVEVYEDTAVTSFSDGDTCTIETADGPTVTARQVVFAAHNPLTRLALQNKLEHYNSYVLAFPATGEATPALVCDTEDPYHYIRTFEYQGKTHWIVGGEDHRTGDEPDTEAPYARLIAWTCQRFGITPGQITHRWSSQVVESADGLPHIGRVPGAKNLWIATGFGGNGMTWGSLAAEMISEAIQGRPSPYADLFEAGRAIPLGDIPTVVRDGAFVAGCYLGDVLKLAETDGVEDVAKGEGRVVRHLGVLVAASRDETGKLSVVKARCPHLGGLVRFNPAEKTWDCPCHGSRFDLEGKVLTGPALTNLETVAVGAKG
ncbi:MAG: FAD-dependent oxidoreductase, partial [Myxococcales bacterium]